jgi:uncharacterized ubiquitin-like protein YukD
MEEEFYIVLSYNGDEFEVDVTNPNDNIRTVIENLIDVLNLPKVDGGGNPSTYFLGKKDENDEEIILHPEIDKREQTLLDYDVESGDILILTMVPLAG